MDSILSGHEKFIETNTKIRRHWVSVYSLAIFAMVWAGEVYGVPDLYVDGRIPLFIEFPTWESYASAEQENETRTGPFINLQRDRLTTKIKSEYRTRGWVYHPALVVFSAGFSPEYKLQMESASSNYDQEDTGVFLGYFIDTTWLQAKPYTITLFSSMNRTDTVSTLTPDINTEMSTNRLSLQLKYPILPTTITLERRDSLTEGLFRSGDTQNVLRLDSRKKTEHGRTDVKIETRQQDREIRDTSFSTDRFSTFLSNFYNFSEKSTLSSGFSFSDSSSPLRDTTITRLNSRFLVRHRKNFSSNYAARIESRDESEFTSFSTSLSAGLSHQLYENLTTSFNVDATKNLLNDGDLNTYLADLGLDYRRRIPWGMLNVNFGVRERIEDNQNEAELSEVRGESHRFSGASTVIFLDNNNIDVSSIVVMDTAGLITYVPGLDYFVETVGNTVRITRDPFAGIGDDANVSVDYRYESDPPAVTGLTTITFGSNLWLWEKLSLFYQRGHSRERLISGIAPEQLNNDTVQQLGAELRWKWSTTRVELEDRDTTLTPIRSLTISETLAFRLGSKLSLGLGVDYSEYTLKDSGDVAEGIGANANLNWSVGRTGQLRARAYTRRSHSDSIRTNSTGLISVYDWRYGAWRPSLRYEYIDDDNQLSGDTRKRHVLFFQVERKFR